jgi:hypothetical protein
MIRRLPEQMTDDKKQKEADPSKNPGSELLR